MDSSFCCVAELVDFSRAKHVVNDSTLFSEYLLCVGKVQRSYSPLEPLFLCCQLALLQCNVVSFLRDLVSLAQLFASQPNVMNVQTLKISWRGDQYLWDKFEMLRRLFLLIALVSHFCFAFAVLLCSLFVFSFDAFCYFGFEDLPLLASTFVTLGHHVVSGVEWMLPWLNVVMLLLMTEEIPRRFSYYKALDFLISFSNLHYDCRFVPRLFALATLDLVY